MAPQIGEAEDTIFAFTELGVAMLNSVLRSAAAIRVNRIVHYLGEYLKSQPVFEATQMPAFSSSKRYALQLQLIDKRSARIDRLYII